MQTTYNKTKHPQATISPPSTKQLKLLPIQQTKQNLNQQDNIKSIKPDNLTKQPSRKPTTLNITTKITTDKQNQTNKQSAKQIQHNPPT